MVRLPPGDHCRLAILTALAVILVSGFSAVPAVGATGLLGAGHVRVTRMILAPRRNALVTRAPVHLVLRIPPHIARLQVRLNGRRIHGRTLNAHTGLKPGLNRLLVRGRQRQRVVVEARTFSYVRRAGRLAQLRVRVGKPSRADVAVRVHARGLSPGRHAYVFRVWLNGRSVTRQFDATHVPNWTASLSASHGARGATNRLRVLLADPEAGRYIRLTRSFSMPTGVPLAGAGRDRRVLAGTRVTLDGHMSRAARGFRLRYRWTLVGRPPGSRARLLGASSVHPTLTTDRPGRYRARLRVTQWRLEGASRRSYGSTSDQITVTSKPAIPMLPAAIPTSGGVTLGADSYPDPAPGGVQVLTVDRSTLSATNGLYTGAAALKAQLSHEGLNQLVIISAPAGAPGAPVAAADVKTFDQALSFMGVPAIPKATLTRPGQALTIIGVPRAAAGSGWFSPAGQHGWLGVDTSDRYAFTPQMPAVNTSSSSTSTQNTMTIAGQAISATSSPAGGWQVVAIDPTTLKVLAGEEFNFSADGTPDPAMGAFMQAQGIKAGALIAVQSIGNVPGIAPGGPVGTALQQLGASTPVLSAGGSYAFVGGTPLAPADVLETSSAVVTDSTTGATMGRSLLARFAPRDTDGVFAPITYAFPGATGVAGENFALYDIVQRPATPWPYTAGGPFPQQPGCGAPGSDPVAYAAAMRQVAQGIGLGQYGSELRNAYLQNDQTMWSDQKVDLAGLQFVSGNGYTAAQWCNLKAELQKEWDWLDDVKTLFDAYKQPFLRVGATELIDLQTLGEDVKNSVRPNGNAMVGWDVFSVIGEVANIFSFLPSDGVAGALIDSIQTAYDLSSEFATSGGSPLPDQVDSKVQALSEQVASQYSDVAAGLDNLRDVVISDYGRLSTLGPLASTPGWAINSGVIDQVTQQLKTGAQAWFAQQLLPLAYKAFTLQPSSNNPNPTTANCSATWIQVNGATDNFVYEPASGQVFLDPRLVALGRGDPDDEGLLDSFKTPPATLTDPLFAPPDQNGLGIYKPWFFLRNFSPFGSADCLDTG